MKQSTALFIACAFKTALIIGSQGIIQKKAMITHSFQEDFEEKMCRENKPTHYSLKDILREKESVDGCTFWLTSSILAQIEWGMNSKNIYFAAVRNTKGWAGQYPYLHQFRTKARIAFEDNDCGTIDDMIRKSREVKFLFDGIDQIRNNIITVEGEEVPRDKSIDDHYDFFGDLKKVTIQLFDKAKDEQSTSEDGIILGLINSFLDNYLRFNTRPSLK